MGKRLSIQSSLYCILVVLPTITVLSSAAAGRTLELKEHGRNISIQIPSILLSGWFQNSEIQLTDTTRSSNHLNLLYGAFDQPLLFYPDNRSGAVFVFYSFDVENHIFAVELDREKENSGMNESLKRIIPSSHGFTVRALTREELRRTAEELNAMTEADYKKLSVPSLDLGLYRFYIPKRRVVESLQQAIKRFDAKDSTRIERGKGEQ